jgi:hypothetical protein
MPLPKCEDCVALALRVAQLELKQTAIIQQMEIETKGVANGLLQAICSDSLRTQKGRYNLTALVCVRMEHTPVSTEKVCEMLLAWYKRTRPPESHTRLLSRFGGNVVLVYTNLCLTDSEELGAVRLFMNQGKLNSAEPPPLPLELREFDPQADVWLLFETLLPALSAYRGLWSPPVNIGGALYTSNNILVEWRLLWPDTDSYQTWRVLRGSLGLKALSNESSIILHLAHMAGIHLNCWQYQQRHLKGSERGRVYLYGQVCVWPIRLALCLCSGFRSHVRNRNVSRPAQLLAVLRDSVTGATGAVNSETA